MPLDPDRLDALYRGHAEAKAALNEICKVLHQFQVPADYKFSRSSALRLAEDLILEGNSDKATTRMRADPAGTISFVRLARKYEDSLETGRYKPEDMTERGILPYQILCEWLLDLMPKISRQWASDEDPFRKK
jgi:hypothetical protein